MALSLRKPVSWPPRSDHPRDNPVSNLLAAPNQVRGVGFFWPYKMDILENLSIIMVWHDAVQDNWRALRSAHQENIPLDPAASLALGPQPRDEDFILFSLSQLIAGEKNRFDTWSYSAALRRLFALVHFRLRDFGQGVRRDFCIEHSFIAFYVAATFGIYGSVESGHGETYMHHIWRANRPNGPIIDTLHCPHVRGYVRDPRDHAQQVHLGREWMRHPERRYEIECGGF